MDFKLLGSILLIVGTSIGAGMLGLPIAAAELGFMGSVMLLFVCWIFMTAGALLILEVNLWLPQNNNLITMAKATIGPLGQIIAWITYLLLLYSLLCAYIAGGSDLFQNLLKSYSINLPLWSCATLFTLLFGTIVYLGIRSVDYVNRGLMSVKAIAYVILVILLMPFISTAKIAAGNLAYLTSASALTVTATSFGYATIIPSLRVYFAGDVKKLKLAIIIGSTIPFICYIIWDAVIMGVIPLNGDHGLAAMLHSSNSTSDLVNTVSTTVATGSVTLFVKLFTSICVLTSFLGVALCLTDFFADGFQLEKKGMGNIFIHAVTFLPALIITIFVPNVFMKALSYAGIYTIVLLVLLPTWMAWRGRKMSQMKGEFRLPGGNFSLVALVIFSIFLVVKGSAG